MLNQNNSNYNNYLITKLEFERFIFFQNNNRLRNANKDNRC